jgi:hypothetical protein
MRATLLACLVLAGCRPPEGDTPENAYRAFAAAAGKKEDAAVAFARLSRASREAVSTRLAGVGQASGGSLREDAAALVFSGERGEPLTAVRLLKKEQDRATVAVTAGGEARMVTMVREGSEWKVEIPREEASGKR